MENSVPVRAPTEICISIDTEFSIGGAFADPKLSPVADRVMEHGLPFLLGLFQRFGIKATFFVEALNTTWFGPERMGGYARLIHQHGHDVQLHLHPCWLHFQHGDWRERCALHAVDDSCSGRGIDDLRRMIGTGLAMFKLWGLPRPVALRTGGLRVDGNVHAAMAEMGLLISSSVGLSYWRPEPALRFSSGIHKIGTVAEIPVCSFDATPRPRLLTITGTGTAEMRALLDQARHTGLSPVMLLTHPFEYVKTADPQYRRTTANAINQGRLDSLLRFLSDHPTEFTPVTIGQSAERWLATDAPDIRLRSPLGASVLRMAANGLNDRIWWL
jgi:hypothetical protein